MSDREGRFADDRLYYQVWEAPKPQGVAVLAHGYAEHSGRYEHVAQALVGGGFATWALDHHGHGRSEGDRADVGSFENAVVDLDAFVDLAVAEHSGLPVFLIGHSMGGLIAVAYAEAHQDRLQGLVLSGAAVAVSEAIAALEQMDEIPVVPLAPLVSRDPAVVADYENDPLNWVGAMPRNMIRQMGSISRVREAMKDITVPLLVMHGSADALVPAQASEDIMATVSSTDKTLRIWDGLYHEIFNEPERDEVLRVMVDWMSAHAP